MRWFFLPVLLAAAAPLAALAQEDTRPVTELSLDQAMVWALENNLDIRIQGHLPDIRSAEVEEARSGFDPVFGTDFNVTSTVNPGNPALTGRKVDENETYTYGSQVRRLTPTGGTWTVRMGGTHTVTNTPELFRTPTIRDDPKNIDRVWRNDASLTLTQPMLRNLGFDFNRSNIHIAQNSLDQAYYTFQQQVQDTVQQVVTAYWNLALAEETLRVQLGSLDRVRRILDLTKLLVQEGKLARHEIYEVESNLGRQLDQVHQSQKAYLDAEDALKRLVAPQKTDLLWGARLGLVTRPTIARPVNPADQSARTALEMRPELRSMDIDIKNADEAILQARNQLLPRLDATGGITLRDFGGSGNWKNSTDTVFSTNDSSGFGWEWTAGVQFEIPIGNRPARSVYTRRVIERRQAEDRLTDLQTQIVNQVREAVRDTNTTYERVDVTSRGVEAAQKRFESEELLFREGKSDNFRLQQFRETLLNTQILEINARFAHAISHIDLARSEGTILRRLRDKNIIVSGKGGSK
ncbi:MAG: TolC family protein [Planctomycetes bacterium]|nr:TolC family protein [Planctomycetota bacterium]